MRARALVHARLDGDAIEPLEAARLAQHLAACATCRDTAAELGQLQRTLREFPLAPLENAALEKVWRRTSRPPGRSRFRPWGGWRLAAAAAAITVALAGLWRVAGPGEQTPPRPTQAELERAATEARTVLALAGRALRRSERASRGVLGDVVSPALRSTSIRWSGTGGNKERNDG